MYSSWCSSLRAYTVSFFYWNISQSSFPHYISLYHILLPKIPSFYMSVNWRTVRESHLSKIQNKITVQVLRFCPLPQQFQLSFAYKLTFTEWDICCLETLTSSSSPGSEMNLSQPTLMGQSLNLRYCPCNTDILLWSYSPFTIADEVRESERERGKFQAAQIPARWSSHK